MPPPPSSRKRSSRLLLLLLLLIEHPTTHSLDADIYDIFADDPVPSTQVSLDTDIYDIFADETTTTTPIAWPPLHPTSAQKAGIDVHRCDILRHPNDPHTPVDWEQPFVTSRPTWPADTLWSNPQSFVDQYGHQPIMVDTPGFFAFQGYSISRQTFRRYIQSQPHLLHDTSHAQTRTLRHGNTTHAQYGFSSFESSEWPEMMQDTEAGTVENDAVDHHTVDHHRAQFNRQTHRLQLHNVEQIAIGPTGTGLHWHRHNAAWNSIVVGHKVWFVSSPHQEPPPGLDANHTTLTWWRTVGKEWTEKEEKEETRTSARTTMDHQSGHRLESVTVTDHNTRQHAEEAQETEPDRHNQRNGPRRSSSGASGGTSTPDNVLVCVLGAQETLYIPSKWWHATINLGAVVSRSVRTL